MQKLLILIALFALGGCASMRPTKPYPSGTSPDRDASVRTPSISHAGLPKGKIGLQQAIEIALANNPEVAAIQWDAAAAQARHDLAYGERLPRFSAVGGYVHHLDEQRLLPIGQPGDPAILSRDIISGDIVLSLPLFTGGRLSNQVRATDLLHQAATHRIARSKEELVFNVSSVFYEILAQGHVIESLEFSGRVLEAHVKRMDALISAQKAAEVDRMRTEVRLADVRQQGVREKNLLAIKRRILANLIGLENAIDQIALEGELELRNDPPVLGIEEALDKARGARDDYVSALLGLEAQARMVDVVRAGHWPTLSLMGSYGGRLAVGPKTGTGEAFGDVGRIGLGMEIPLFEGGRVNARVREQRAHLAAAQARFRKLELQIRLEIEIAISNIMSSQERVDVFQKAIAQARESLRIEQQKYDLGKGAIVDVLDAQATLLATETTYYRVQAELQTALAQLKWAIGEE